MTQLTNLRLAGWKSIREAEIEFRPLNVLIGGNGAGKSNLVGFFKMIGEMRAGRLQVHVRVVGGAESLLHYGSKQTSAIDARFHFTTEAGQSSYFFRLVPTVSNSLIFDEEKLTKGDSTGVRGNDESRLEGLFNFHNPSIDFDWSGKSVSAFLTRCQVYHFHDTSRFSPMRKECPINDNRHLYPDASNLPAMLYLYRERFPTAYRRIVAAVKAVAPFFNEFVLEPVRLRPHSVELRWRAKESSYEFGPHQLSDGTLRAIALCTLLLQPEEDLPELIVLDEPELGLHPAALAVLSDLLKAAARHSQLLVATQSTVLIDHFDVEDIVTVNLRDGVSTFERLDPERLKQWLEEYTVSELWERNVIGGGPY